MAQPVPDPVLGFLIRYLANPNDRELWNFCSNLLGLELARAERYVGPDGPPFELPDGYRSDVVTARRSLEQASDGDGPLDLAFHWLVLMGHRIGTERGLATGGTDALALIAAARLKLPLKETEIWSDEMFFRQYTETMLRDEWDYPGIAFRAMSPLWPVEGL